MTKWLLYTTVKHTSRTDEVGGVVVWCTVQAEIEEMLHNFVAATEVRHLSFDKQKYVGEHVKDLAGRLMNGRDDCLVWLSRVVV